MSGPRPDFLRDRSRYPRILWFLALVVQMVGLAFMSGHRAFPVAMVVVALAGLPGRVQLSLTRAWKQRLTVLLAALPAAAVLFARGDAPPPVTMTLPYDYSIALAQFCAALQVAQFFLAQPGDRFPVFVTLLGFLTLLLAGNLVAGDPAHLVYRELSLGFGAFAVAFCSASAHRRTGRGVRHGTAARIAALGLLIAMTCGLAWFGGFLAIRLEGEIVDFLGWLQGGSKPYPFEKSAAGFSTRPWFESMRQWKATDESGLALRVYSVQEPGYLRARVFTDFVFGPQCGWSAMPVRGGARPPSSTILKGMPPLAEGENVFDLWPDADWSGEPGLRTRWRTMDVRPVQQMGDAFFTPLGARLLAARLPFVQVDPVGVAQTTAPPPGGGYRVFIPPVERNESLTSETRNACLHLPDSIDPRIRQLADDVLQGHASPRDKMAAVVNYFRTNYQYKLYQVYTTVPKGTDLITYFLTQKPPGHCEYFATGAAILLRLGGVPCRYVNGFVVDEKNGPGGFWVARNRDAHAWVEAYDSETRMWRIVDATPSSGVPSEATRPTAGWLSQWWDAVKAWFAGLRTAFQTGELKAWFLACWAAFCRRVAQMLPAALAVGGAAAAVGALLGHLRRKRLGGAGRKDAAAAAARQLLARVDRLVARHGLERSPSETLHRFADRLLAEEACEVDLRPAADWYRRYAALRYGAPLEDSVLDAMRETCPRALPRSDGGTRPQTQ